MPPPQVQTEAKADPIATLGLAAFAVSAFIRTVLVPDLAAAPVPRTASLAGTLLAEGGAPRSGNTTPTVAGGAHRANASWGSVDAELMRQLDQARCGPAPFHP